ncbi:division/cell wall cluster transcriptional repressor MraZ [Ethanoligenens sp.]|uniref:division/cell wall cluster transcriptional repressor MraZ n=1 Tax=Ethanoligenens sp. TaxID=2099655 RepID=UPI0039EBFBE5
MLIGEYQHNIDAKGRVFMPARLREDLGERFILCKGLDNCLFVYSATEWSALEARIRALPLSKGRQLQRFFFSGACDVEADKQGRIVLPANLRTYAGLERDVMIIGASTRVEIWDSKRWETACAAITPEAVEQAMEELGF